MHREFVWKCGDCGFWDNFGAEGDDVDKCPYCKSDNWIGYERVERETDEDDE